MDSKTYERIRTLESPEAQEIARHVVIDESIPTGQIRRNGQAHAVLIDDQVMTIDRGLRRAIEVLARKATRSGVSKAQLAAVVCAVLGVDPGLIDDLS